MCRPGVGVCFYRLVTKRIRHRQEVGAAFQRSPLKQFEYPFGQNMTEHNPAPSLSGHPLLSASDLNRYSKSPSNLHVKHPFRGGAV
eukprot:scaffold120378_cov64-Phaeocystis_antarctica.AAC.1